MQRVVCTISLPAILKEAVKKWSFVQVVLEHRAVVQKTQTKLSAPLFLFRNRKQDKDPSIVCVDRTVALTGIESVIRK